MKTPTIVTQCPLCGSTKVDDYQVLYPAHLPAKALNSSVFSARRLPDTIHYQLVQCKNDSMVRSCPVYPDEVAAELYKRSIVTYQDQIQHLTSTYLQALQPVISKLNNTAAILEIGCGSGFVLSALKKQGFKKIFGIEPSEHAVEEAPKDIKSHIICKPFSKKAVGSKTFDLIFLFQTLDHLPKVNQFMEECYSSLNPGGYLVSFHHDFDFPLRKWLGERHPIIDIEHLQLFSAKTSAALFERHGLLIDTLSSPITVVSLSHLVWLLPLPNSIKLFFVSSLQKLPFLNPVFNLELGNVLIIGQKPRVE